MNITYTQNGDYLIPNIVIRKTKPLGHYGRLRKAYLKMHRPIPVSYTHLDVYKRQVMEIIKLISGTFGDNVQKCE